MKKPEAVRMVCAVHGCVRRVPIVEAVHRTPRCCQGVEMLFAGEPKADRWRHTGESGFLVDPAESVPCGGRVPVLTALSQDNIDLQVRRLEERHLMAERLRHRLASELGWVKRMRAEGRDRSGMMLELVE